MPAHAPVAPRRAGRHPASSRPLDRDLLTRRDHRAALRRRPRARAATLMREFRGRADRQPVADPPANVDLLRFSSGNIDARAAFRGEVERRDRLVAELRKARVTGIRVTLPAETLDAKLASLPEGVSVSRDRIEVRFSGAQEAVGRLFALAQALTHDYAQFEALVDGATPGAAGER